MWEERSQGLNVWGFGGLGAKQKSAKLELGTFLLWSYIPLYECMPQTFQSLLNGQTLQSLDLALVNTIVMDGSFLDLFSFLSDNYHLVFHCGFIWHFPGI